MPARDRDASVLSGRACRRVTNDTQHNYNFTLYVAGPKGHARDEVPDEPVAVVPDEPGSLTVADLPDEWRRLAERGSDLRAAAYAASDGPLARLVNGQANGLEYSVQALELWPVRTGDGYEAPVGSVATRHGRPQPFESVWGSVKHLPEGLGDFALLLAARGLELKREGPAFYLMDQGTAAAVLEPMGTPELGPMGTDKKGQHWMMTRLSRARPFQVRIDPRDTGWVAKAKLVLEGVVARD